MQVDKLQKPVRKGLAFLSCRLAVSFKTSSEIDF
jgi:hypothetical protein